MESEESTPEHDISIYLQRISLVALYATVAPSRTNRCIIYQGRWDHDHVIVDADSHAEGGKCSSLCAGEDVAADRIRVSRVWDLGIVLLGDAIVDDEEGGAGICNGGRPREVVHLLTTNRDPRGRELPESIGAVDRNPGELTVKFRCVDGPKLVKASSIFFEISGKDRLRQAGQNIVEECLLLYWFDY